MVSSRTTGNILGTEVEVTTTGRACECIVEMSRTRDPAYICFATAHMLVEASRDESVKNAYEGAAMINADGVPVAWSLRLFGQRGAECVSGPQLTKSLLERAAAENIKVGFYGGRQETIERMTRILVEKHPSLSIAYAYSPPFRLLEDQERAAILQAVNEAGVQMLFVGLGSIKQELWMREASASLNCVCLGVGAAFEFLSGEKVLPPVWIQRAGLAWLVRLCQEPRRLARRNLYSPIFAWMVFRQWIAGPEKVADLQLLPDTDSSSEGGAL